jgi:thioesterase domain-containing protein
MFNEIENRFGRKQPLATLFKSQTIEKLALVLSDENISPDWSSIVPIQTGGNNPPFFCIHGAGGNVLLYKDLANRLGTDQPFYGIQSKGLDESGEYHSSIEEMATYYLDEILKTQPEEPYIIGGYCMGGTIAYEIAQQLRKKGLNVALVALLDTYNFKIRSRNESMIGNLSYYYQNTVFHLKNLLKAPAKEKITFIKEKIKITQERTVEKMSFMISSISSKINGAGKNKPSQSLQKLNDQAALNYNPEHYPGNVVVFKPQATFSTFDDPSLGWGDLVKGNLKIVELPLYPKGMIVEPFVQSLAEKLRHEIDNTL